MKLSAPTQPVFYIAVLLFLAGLLAFLGVVSIPSVPPFYLAAAGFVLLALGNALKGL